MLYSVVTWGLQYTHQSCICPFLLASIYLPLIFVTPPRWGVSFLAEIEFLISSLPTPKGSRASEAQLETLAALHKCGVYCNAKACTPTASTQHGGIKGKIGGTEENCYRTRWCTKDIFRGLNHRVCKYTKQSSFFHQLKKKVVTFKKQCSQIY